MISSLHFPLPISSGANKNARLRRSWSAFRLARFAKPFVVAFYLISFITFHCEEL